MAFVNLFVLVFNFLIIIRVVLSWFQNSTEHAFGRFIFETTEPVLAPIRKLLPQNSMLDLSPIVAFFLLQILQGAVSYLIVRL